MLSQVRLVFVLEPSHLANLLDCSRFHIAIVIFVRKLALHLVRVVADLVLSQDVCLLKERPRALQEQDEPCSARQDDKDDNLETKKAGNANPRAVHGWQLLSIA